MSLAIDWFKTQWNQGNKSEALRTLINQLPQLTLGILWPSKFSEEKQLELFNQNGWQFLGPNSIPSWWREVFHWLGGFGITILFFAWPPVCFLASICIAIWKAWGEFVLDAQGQPDLKNVVDWSFWLLGTLSATIPSFLLFGTYPYK